MEAPRAPSVALVGLGRIKATLDPRAGRTRLAQCPKFIPARRYGSGNGSTETPWSVSRRPSS